MSDLTSVVIVTYNSRDDIAGCLEALSALDGPRPEIIVVDNASTDSTADLVAERFPSVRLVRSASNLGFGGGNNLGFAVARGDLLVTVNPDVRLRPDALTALRGAFAADERLGIAGAKLLFADGQTIQHAGGIVEYPLATTRHRGYGEADRGQFDEPADVEFVTGAALALRRAVVEQIHGFDAGFYPVYFEDTDLCYRARAAGWRVKYIPVAVGLHPSSASLSQASETYFRYFHTSRLRFVAKHYTIRQLVDDFLPAELERLRQVMPAADRAAAGLMYRSLQPENAAQEVHQPMPNLTPAAPGSPPEPPVSAEALEYNARALLAELNKRWQVQERPFASRTPIVGPLVARLRTLWNNMSTTWYVRSILQQQVEFNSLVVQTMAALAGQTAEVRRTCAAAVEQANAQLAEQRALDQQLIRQLTEQEQAARATPVILGQRIQILEERLAVIEQKDT